MNKSLLISTILFLILFTAFIKNSTKKIEDEVFVLQENIRVLKKEYENSKLEFDYLSSSEKLQKFQNLYFDGELTKKDLGKIMIIKKIKNNLEVKTLKILDERK